jgi:hypothetical protein
VLHLQDGKVTRLTLYFSRDGLFADFGLDE